MVSFRIWSKEGKIDYVRAEHDPEERLVAPNRWATLSVHVVASPASQAALEVGGVSVDFTRRRPKEPLRPASLLLTVVYRLTTD